jgi:hypothetical protein
MSVPAREYYQGNHHHYIESGVNLEAAANIKPGYPDRARLAVFGKQQASDQKPANDEKEVNTAPAWTPQHNIPRRFPQDDGMAVHHHRDRNGTQNVDLRIPLHLRSIS